MGTRMPVNACPAHSFTAADAAFETHLSDMPFVPGGCAQTARTRLLEGHTEQVQGIARQKASQRHEAKQQPDSFGDWCAPRQVRLA